LWHRGRREHCRNRKKRSHSILQVAALISNYHFSMRQCHEDSALFSAFCLQF